MPNWSDMLKNIGKTAVNQTNDVQRQTQQGKAILEMCKCTTPMAEPGGMCVRTEGLISYSALKKEECFSLWLDAQGLMAAVRFPALSPPWLSQDGGFCSCQNSCSLLFPESLRDRRTKGGMHPWHPHGLCPEEWRTPSPFPWLLQPDCLPALRGTVHTHHSSPHQHTPVICVPHNVTRCSPLPPKRSQFQQAPPAVSNKLILHNHYPIATSGDVMYLSVTKGWEVQTLGHVMGLLKWF